MQMLIDTHDVDALAARFTGGAAVVERQIGQAMTEAAIRVQSGARDNVRNDGKVDTGRLLNSITYEVRSNQATITAGSDGLTYAAAINNGRAPGTMPPPGELLPWMKRKGIPAEAEYPIRLKILRRGTVGTQFMERATEAAMPDINRYFNEAIGRATQELAG